MGTQIGNVTPLDVEAATDETNAEENGSETGSFSEPCWTEEGPSDF